MSIVLTTFLMPKQLTPKHQQQVFTKVDVSTCIHEHCYIIMYNNDQRDEKKKT